MSKRPKAPIFTSCIFFVFSSVMFSFRGAMSVVRERDVSFDDWEGGGVFGISNLDHFLVAVLMKILDNTKNKLNVIYFLRYEILLSISCYLQILLSLRIRFCD